MMIAKIRLRLHFAVPPPISSPLNKKRFMFLIDKEKCFNITDVKIAICKQFGFPSTDILSLLINGFLLMPNDDVDIIRDDEEVTVIYCDGKDQLLYQHETMSQNSNNTSLAQPESKENSTSCQNSVDTDLEKKTVLSDVDDMNNIDKSCEATETVFNAKKRKKKKRKADDSQDVKLSFSPAQNASPSSADAADIQKKSPNGNVDFKPKHKKKRKKSVHTSEISIGCSKKNGSSESLIKDAEEEEVVRDESSNSKHKHKKKKKKIVHYSEVNDDNSLTQNNSPICSINNSDTLVEISKKDFSEPKSTQKKKKKKSNNDKTFNKQSYTQINNSSSVQAELNPDGSVTEDKNDEKPSQKLRKRDVEFDRQTDAASIKNSKVDNSSKSNMTDVKTFLKCDDYEKLTTLTWPPRIGDRIAFKTMGMAEDYTPFLTDFLEASVLNIIGASVELELLHPSHCLERHRGGKFDMDCDGSDSDESVKVLKWTNLIDPRLVT